MTTINTSRIIETRDLKKKKTKNKPNTRLNHPLRSNNRCPMFWVVRRSFGHARATQRRWRRRRTVLQRPANLVRGMDCERDGFVLVVGLVPVHRHSAQRHVERPSSTTAADSTAPPVSDNTRRPLGRRVAETV